MKAIRTLYHGPTERRGSRISASTGERGQRIFLSDWGSMNVSEGHALAARKLCEKMDWYTDMIGGAFPDGSMVWVFAASHDRTIRRFQVKISAKLPGALGIPSERREYWINGVGAGEVRSLAIDRAITVDNLEHVTVISAEERPL